MKCFVKFFDELCFCVTAKCSFFVFLCIVFSCSYGGKINGVRCILDSYRL